MSASDPRPSQPHGYLPPWRTADLPEPLPFSFRNTLRTIGPGAILLAAAIGGGEWIVGPRMMVLYGPGILWVATGAIILQALFNMEGVRYTLYTGEPILTGVMRLWPGPRLWAPFYIVLGVAQLATPALALGSAGALFTAFAHTMPDADNLTIRHNIASAIVLVTIVLLLSGKKIEKVLERVSWLMIVFIFGFLFYVNAMVVPVSTSMRTLQGFVTPQPLPSNIDLLLLALFAGTAGSGGLGNLVISSWFRDKGFGMGKHMGAIGGLLAGDKQLEPVGYTFPPTPENHRRWGTWWQYAQLDQIVLWAGGCFLGMFLNVNLVSFIVPANNVPPDAEAGVFQARFLAEHLGSMFYALALLNGFWILYSTHLGNTDCLVRTICDIVWSGFPRARRWPAGRIYALILIVVSAWGLYSLRLADVLRLFTILGVISAPIMAVAAAQILIVNNTLLPRELRPAWWRQAALVLCTLIYGTFAVVAVPALMRDLAKMFSGSG